VLIAIHRDADHPDGYAEGWADSLLARGVDVRRVNLTGQDALRQIQDCDGVMWHWGRTPSDKKIYRILTVIELQLGIPVFPNHCSSWHRRNKLAQYYLYQAAGVPMPKTWVFWDQQRAREWALQTDYPNVFKLSEGGGGEQVILVSSSEEACHLINRMFGPEIYASSERLVDLPRYWQQLRSLARRLDAAARYIALGEPPSSSPEKGYVYFQEFVPGNDYETGILVIGDRAFGSRILNGTEGFRSRSGKSYDPSHIDIKCVELAFDISERLGFPMMAYDILLHHGEAVVLEMNFRNGKARGYWKRNLEWVSEPISPQEAQVETFVNEIRFGEGKSGAIPGPSPAGVACQKIMF